VKHAMPGSLLQQLQPVAQWRLAAAALLGRLGRA
jgi:hypothetical protein